MEKSIRILKNVIMRPVKINFIKYSIWINIFKKYATEVKKHNEMGKAKLKLNTEKNLTPYAPYYTLL